MPTGLRNSASTSRQPRREFQPPLDRLIAVGHAAHRDDLRLPLGRGEFLAQQLGRVFLDHDARLEIQAGGEAEILVRGPRVAVDAAVLAAAIRIDAELEADVRAVVAVENRAAMVAEELRRRQRVFLRIPIHVALEMNLLEAVGRIAGRAAGGDGIWFA